MLLGRVEANRCFFLFLIAARFRRDVIDGFLFTEHDTLRLPATQITLEHALVCIVISHRPEGTGTHTRSAADAYIVINTQETMIFIPFDGPHRADGLTRCVFTLRTDHRHIDANVFPLDDRYPAPGRIGDPVMAYGTHQLAETAPGALLIVNRQYFLHKISPNITRRLQQM